VSFGASFERTVDALDKLGRLPNGRPSGMTLMALCPSHDDRKPSLKVTHANDKTLLYCHAGCAFDDVIGALGLAVEELFDDWQDHAARQESRDEERDEEERDREWERRRARPKAKSQRSVTLVPASAIRTERVQWLLRDRFALRSLAVVAGEKGLGKSTYTNARLPAEATRGLLDGELRGKPIDVVIATAEDDWRTVVKPRLIAHGADMERILQLTVTDEDGVSLLTLPDDVARLEAEIVALRNSGRTVGMLVIDPIGAFLAQSTDTHRDASVRRALAPLAAMADRLDLVVIVVCHLTKDQTARLINRVSGAGAFVNAARSVLVLARHPDDPDGEQGAERVLVHVGSNWGRYARSLHARVESRPVNLDDGNRAQMGYLRVLGECDIGVDDLQGGAHDTPNGSDVEEAIGLALADGPRSSLEVKDQVAAERDCSRRSVERAAGKMQERGELAIESIGFPRRTVWSLVVPARAGSGATGATGSDSGAKPPSDKGFSSGATPEPPNGATDCSGAKSDTTGATSDVPASSGASGAGIGNGGATGAEDWRRPPCTCPDGGIRDAQDPARCGRCWGWRDNVNYDALRGER
jgi:hypothetical protein